MRRRSIGLEALAALFILAPTAHAVADVPPLPIDPSTTKRVPAMIEVDDWGPLADRVSTKHVVAAGETLRAIATKELGDVSRWKAIADANPEVAANPDKIAAGATLWLPSKASLEKAPATGATASTKPPGFAPWYDAFWTIFRPKQGLLSRATQLLGRATPGEVPAEAREGATLLFVPHEQAAALLAVVSKPPEDIAPLIKDTRPLRVDLHPDTLLHKDDPTVRIVTRFRLQGVDGVWAAHERVRYDAAGQVVTKEWPLRRVSPGDSKPGSPPPEPGASSASSSVTVAVTASPAPNPPPGLPSPHDDILSLKEQTPSNDGSRWPATTGVLVAAAGAALVGAFWWVRRRRIALVTSHDEPPTDPHGA